MTWTVHNEHTVYENPWLRVNLADVELPDGRHLDHYLLRQRPVVTCAILDASTRVLMLWRHRFITNAWGWELPSGVANNDDGGAVLSATREAEEETGWRPRSLRPLVTLAPLPGLSDCVNHVYWTDQAEFIGPPVDAHESSRVEWLPLKEIPTLVSEGSIRESSTVAALLQLYTMLDIRR
ncbi:MAG TPA: NUDIX hydrolase [Micromonosporaceae bacterium]|nr:NUDIX hydrolase [Micromonosporaceae bacterium]